MKLRSGFVSNSSSSSFLIPIWEDIDTPEKLILHLQDIYQEMFNPDEDTYPDSCFEIPDNLKQTIKSAIHKIYGDMHPLTKKNKNYYIQHHHDYASWTDRSTLNGEFIDDNMVHNIANDVFESYNDPKRQRFEDRWKKAFSQWNKLLLKTALNRHLDVIWYEVEYEDNSADYGVMEHGKHWEFISAIRISHH